MDLGMAGKWALVCGASKGVGLGCAQALACITHPINHPPTRSTTHRKGGAQALVGDLVGHLLQAQRHVQALIGHLVHCRGWRGTEEGQKKRLKSQQVEVSK